MITFQQILNGESGLSTRAKINSILSALVNGEEGINASWIFLRALESSLDNLSEREISDIERVREDIGGTLDYTDRVAGKFYTYIDAMNGGVGGLVDSPSYDPSDLPTDKPVTLVALGSGTFINLKDVTDTPITISNPNSVTVFYRAANLSYWDYRSNVLSAPVIDQDPTSGNTDHVVSSDGVYRADLNLLRQIGYFVCDTNADTAAKTIVATGYALTTGGNIRIKMTNANTANNATLNINSTGAKPLYYDGERASANNTWEAGETVEVYYDGTNFYANNVAGGGGDGVFDVSEKYPTSGVEGGNTYTLDGAIAVLNANLPASKKKGGMSIKFVHTSDNKYVQYRYLLSSITNSDFKNVDNWVGVDVEMVAGSKNLIESNAAASLLFGGSGVGDKDVFVSENKTLIKATGEKDSATNYVIRTIKLNDFCNVTHVVCRLRLSTADCTAIAFYNNDVISPDYYMEESVLSPYVSSEGWFNVEANVPSGCKMIVISNKDSGTSYIPTITLNVEYKGLMSVIDVVHEVFDEQIDEKLAEQKEIIDADIARVEGDVSDLSTEIEHIDNEVYHAVNVYDFTLDLTNGISSYGSKQFNVSLPINKTYRLSMTNRSLLEDNMYFYFASNDGKIGGNFYLQNQEYLDIEFTEDYSDVTKLVAKARQGGFPSDSPAAAVYKITIDAPTDSQIWHEIDELKQDVDKLSQDVDVIKEQIPADRLDILALNPESDVHKVLSQMAAYESTTENKSLMLIHTSDVHGGRHNIMQRMYDFYSKYSTYIDEIICSGDMVSNSIVSPGEMDFIDNVDGLAEKMLMVIGNHDNQTDTTIGFDSGTAAEAFDYIMRGRIDAWGVEYTENLNYWYKDKSDEKIRIIGLDYMHYDVTQANWFISTLNDTLDSNSDAYGYTVLVVCHIAPAVFTAIECPFTSHVGRNTSSHRSTDIGFTDETKSMAYIVDSFIQDGGKFAAWLVGHTHTDCFGYYATEGTNRKQTVICIDTAGAFSLTSGTISTDHLKNTNDKSRDLFNVISINTSKHTMCIKRIGLDCDMYMRHIDRMCWDYENGVIVSES